MAEQATAIQACAPGALAGHMAAVGRASGGTAPRHRSVKLAEKPYKAGGQKAGQGGAEAAAAACGEFISFQPEHTGKGR